MRIKKSRNDGVLEGDMTPMIDMTFQLIAFFMVLVNFSKVEQDRAVMVPLSELAKPPKTAYDEPITLQVLESGKVLLRGRKTTIDELKGPLGDYRRYYEMKEVQPEDITLIIRADKDLPANDLQHLIEVCQEARFVTFALRAQAEERRRPPPS